MSEFDKAASVVPTRFVVRSREGLQCFGGPSSVTPEAGGVSVKEDSSHGLHGISGLRFAPLYSPDGSRVCLVKTEGQAIAMHDGTTGELVGEVPVLEVSTLEFSPKGTYLITWSRPMTTKDGAKPTDNLLVHRVSDMSLVGSFFQKSYKKDALQWTDDEKYLALLVTNEVRILNADGFNIVGKCIHKGLTQCRLSPRVAEGEGGFTVGTFVPEKGGKPASVSLYTWKEGTEMASGPHNSRTVFAASEASMMWNSKGTSLLIHTHSDVDKSGGSYYGATGLYVLTTPSAGGISEKLSQSKEGPVYDVKWSPLGDRFVVSAGHMPSRSTLYNEKAQALYEFGEAHRNTVVWSPHSRFVCVAGFGNLAGEMDFYDTVKLKKMGANISHCAVQFGWSPDSRYFMTATLAPRMNVDNGFKIFKYNGIGPVAEKGYTQAFDCLWQPQPSALFPDRGQSPRREGDAKPIKDVSVLKEKASVGAYRPPAARASGTPSLAERMRREAAPVGKVKTASSGSTSVGGVDVFRGGGMRFAPRSIPGMSAEQAKKSTPAMTEEEKEAKKAKEKAKKEAKKAAQEAAAKAEAEAAAAAKAAAAAPKAVSDMTPEEKEKRAKAIKKKLKSIAELKEKGGELNEDQQKKIAGEAELIKELEGLGL